MSFCFFTIERSGGFGWIGLDWSRCLKGEEMWFNKVGRAVILAIQTDSFHEYAL